MTIREAAWLTDDTYKYEDIVRMMGEITACVSGAIKVRILEVFIINFHHMKLFSLYKDFEALALSFSKNMIDTEKIFQ